MNICTDRFNHVLDRYNSKRVVTEEFSKIEMDFALKSINLEKEKFNNFAKTEKNEQYLLVKELYSKYKSGINILDEFEAYDIELYSKNTSRLAEILTYNNLEPFSCVRTSNVLKFRLSNSNNTLRIYVEKVNKNNQCILKIRLIDLYHLAIPSRYKSVSADKMKNRLYEQHKRNKINISTIKNKI